MGKGLSDWRDILVLSLYFVFVLAVGIWSSCRKGRETVKGYFLAGRNLSWLPIGFSLFASNIGSEHFIGLAGSGAKSGIAVVAFEWGAVLCLLLLGWIFLPVYLTSGIYTMPEYLGRRFGGARLRIYLSLIAILLYAATKISVDIYAGSVFIQQALGWNTYISIAGLLVVTAIYTLIGGLSAVIFTDTLQTVIMLTGSVILAVMAYVKVGGLWALEYKYMEAMPLEMGNSTCGMPRKDAFHIFRNAVHGDLPWPGVVIRSTLVSIWYWCADQVIVQRTLAAKNIGHARGAVIAAGYLKILPLFLIIFPGMISRVLFTDDVACADPQICKAVCDNEAGCSNIAYPKLILELAPVGLKGVMVAVMMSAVMSSLTSIFNSAATLFTMDIWKKVRPQASEKEQLITGRLFVVVLVGTSILWIPLIKSSNGAELFIYIQAVTGYIVPPVCAVFLLAIFVPRINEQGAFWGLAVGQMVGIARMVLGFIYTDPPCGTEDTRPGIVADINFTYVSAILLAISAIVTVGVSLLTSRSDVNIDGLTIWSVHKLGRKRNRMTLRTKAIIQDNRLQKLNNVESQQYLQDKSRMKDTSKNIHDLNGDLVGNHGDDIELDINKDKQELATRYKQMMTITKKSAVFLNINAALLISVFIMCYAIFH